MSMNEEAEILSEADEIAALLPWYVSGKISAADKARVDAYAKAHPEVAAHIALAREEADAVFAANQEIHVPWAAIDKLIERLEASPSVRVHGMKASILDRVGAFLDALTPRQLAYAGLAAALAIAIQAASIGALLQGQETSGYQTASGQSQSLGKGSFALVGFKPTVTQAALTGFLDENKLSIVDGPRAGGLYQVRVSEDALSQDALATAVAKLKARADIVAFASPAPSSP